MTLLCSSKIFKYKFYYAEKCVSAASNKKVSEKLPRPQGKQGNHFPLLVKLESMTKVRWDINEYSMNVGLMKIINIPLQMYN